tara:strand:- start:4109 stop:5374 length:1266 start_codon:yes stop_codon:yes gene_type:complete
MYWLIEDLEQLTVFYNSGFKEAFIDVIPESSTLHPTLNEVSAVYIRPVQSSKGFMIGVNHSETLGLKKEDVTEVLKKFDKLYCRDKKEILHYFCLKSFVDISLPPHTYIQNTTTAHDWFNTYHKNVRDINVIIPIVKHYEMCERTFNDLIINTSKDTKYGTFFNERTSLVFNLIERNGIAIRPGIFGEHFYETKEKKVYTQFNLKTTTTRPSNRFKGVNYAALNKENGCRKAFIPENNKFIEIDITAYHPSIAASLISYDFGTDDIHSAFAEMYRVDRDQAKELTFKQLYGGVFKQYRDIEFFKRISDYINQRWEEFTKIGYVECPISHYRFYNEELENMNPQKLFNYMLQNYETSQNILILWDILSILVGKKTKLVLYTYDSFLIDIDESEEEVLKDVENVFQKYNLNIKNKEGYDYDFR